MLYVNCNIGELHPKLPHLYLLGGTELAVTRVGGVEKSKMKVRPGMDVCQRKVCQLVIRLWKCILQRMIIDLSRTSVS